MNSSVTLKGIETLYKWVLPERQKTFQVYTSSFRQEERRKIPDLSKHFKKLEKEE